MFTKYFDIEHLIHSIKTVIACLIGLLLTKLIGFSSDLWVVLSIIVVMCAQIYVGSVIQKAYLRFLGTLVGCLFATNALLIAGATTLSIAISIGLSSFIFSYIATGKESLSYAGTLGAATTAIIMLSPNPTIRLAIERFFEISLGVLIATLVSQFVLPIHAFAHLRRTQAKTLEELRDYYISCIVTQKKEAEINFEDQDESIIKLITKQRQLVKESSREPLRMFYDSLLFIQSLRCEREILRSIDFMHNALIHIKDLDPTILKAFNESILQTFTTLIKAIESDEVIKEHVHQPPLTALKEEIQKNKIFFTGEILVYMNGFTFSAEMLVNYLMRLANLYQITILDAIS